MTAEHGVVIFFKVLKEKMQPFIASYSLKIKLNKVLHSSKIYIIRTAKKVYVSVVKSKDFKIGLA